MRKSILSLLLACFIAFAPGTARAGIPVIDVTAVANLIQQISYWQQQISAMAQELNQLKMTHAAMTGNRGMQSLLPMTNLMRNYLPPDYAELLRVLDGNSNSYAGLSSQVQSALQANAVLSNAQLGALTPQMRELVEDSRRTAAMTAALARVAFQNTSQRFAALQALITMIGSAFDIKAIQDLQGRIAAEQAMLTNEQTKLQTLYQVAQAEQLIQQQRIRERAAADVGSVSSMPSVRY